MQVLYNMEGKKKSYYSSKHEEISLIHCPSLFLGTMLAYFFFHCFKQNKKMLEFTLQKQRR